MVVVIGTRLAVAGVGALGTVVKMSMVGEVLAGTGTVAGGIAVD
jgi:hypothetical protein